MGWRRVQGYLGILACSSVPLRELFSFAYSTFNLLTKWRALEQKSYVKSLTLELGLRKKLTDLHVYLHVQYYMYYSGLEK